MSDDTIDLVTAIDQIINSNERIRKFWTEEATGWSPKETAELLENARMDRLVSLSHGLRLWMQPSAKEDQEGRLILAWANLGVLVEGTMTWFLCVYESSYSQKPVRTQQGVDLQPNRLRFEELCRYYRANVWTNGQITEWDDWLTMVRNRRNAIHAFNHREIGTWGEWSDSVIRYRSFIEALDSSVPYPDAHDHYT